MNDNPFAYPMVDMLLAMPPAVVPVLDPAPLLPDVPVLDPAPLLPDVPFDLPCPHASCFPLQVSPLANVPSPAPEPGGVWVAFIAVAIVLSLRKLGKHNVS